MADLLATWLNEEVGLSKRITNFEDDFASGYLFGELLYKYNQQSDFHNFSTKIATSHYVMNFEKLEPTLRSLNVQFNSKTVEQIMKGERGQALRLLYQLKMVLEKVYPPADISIVAKTGTFGDNQPAQRIAFSKPKYDEVSHTFFKQRLGKLNRAQKDIDLEQHLQPFTDEMNRQASNAHKLDLQDKVNDQHNKQEMRRIQINKLQRNAGFMEEWLAKGVEDWKTNMSIKREREAAQLEFDFTQAEKYNEITKQKLNEAQDEVHLGIENFEKNLKAQGISTKVDKEQADRMIKDTLEGKGWEASQSPQRTMQGQTKLDFTKTFDAKASTKKGNFTLTSTGLKHRTKKTVTDKQRNEREKRRRRLINQQAELFKNLECETRQQNAQHLMRRQSKQEKELDYEAWRTTQCKNIVVENRKLREQQYETRRRYDEELSIEKEQRLIAEMQEASNREIDQMVVRTGELKEYEQQYKKQQRTELCGQLLDKIFDIADEAYNHMQDLDSKEWDQRNWNEWLKLFVHKQTVAGTMSELLTEEDTDTQAQQSLDDAELRDYLNNQGQWPTALVSENKLNLNDVMNPKVEAAAPAGKGKPAGKAPAQAEVQLDEADLELPDSAQNNHIFGDVVDQLIKLYYPPRPNLKHPPTPNYLALKVCLAGYPFAGKKTQAEKIRQKYGLNVFVMEDLINEAITFQYNPDEHKWEQPPAHTEEEGEGLSEDECLETNPFEEYQTIGQEIKEQLLDGGEITDQQYVRLFVCKLRCTYPYKTPVEKRREVEQKAKSFVEIQKRLSEIEVEKNKEDIPKKLKKQLQDEENSLNNQLDELEKLPTDGWVLVDFPSSYAQAKLLEQALSGYVPQEELAPTEREQELQDALLLVQPQPEPNAVTKLIKSGLDCVIWLDLPAQECLRRSDGRRFDSANPDQRYHVFDQIPPHDQAPLCERLLPLSEDNNLVSGLPDRFIAFDQNKRAMSRWLKQFGDEEKSLQLLCMSDGARSEDEIFKGIHDRLNTILENREEKFMDLRDQLAQKVQQAMEQQKAQEEEEAAKETSQLNSARSGNNLTPSLSPSQSARKDKTVESQVKKSEVQGTEPSASITPRAVAPMFGRNNIEAEFRPTLIKLWQDLSSNYKKQMKRIFHNIRRNRETSFKSQADVQHKFLEFLHRSDEKQELLNKFVADFNKFSDDFPDLREDEATKDELHQRCDVLSDELWEIVEERKEQNAEERKKIMESGSVENNLDFLTTCAQQLMQSELDKFKTSIQIIHDYYFAIEEKTTHELTGNVTAELAFGDEEAPQIEVLAEGQDINVITNYSYPKLEKLLQMALKQQVVPDVTKIEAAAGDKKAKAPPPKKGAPAAKDEPEAPSEESPYVKEMKEAVKVEKQILRFRLVQIRNWTLQRLQQTRQTALNTYKKFEDWIQVAQKAEMDTIEEMCSVIKKAIEDESKIQHELRISFMDFTVDNATFNYINPPVPKLDAIEDHVSERFNIAQLRNFISEFEQISASTGDLMQCRELANLLYNKIKNASHYVSHSCGIAASWQQFGLAEINWMIRNLDHSNTGYVNWRVLMTYIILLRSEVASAKEISRIEKMLKDAEVEEDRFVEGEYWFEQTERTVDRENAIEFERVKFIKQLLFRTHCCEGKLNVGKFATVLGQIGQRAASGAKYFDVLFDQVKI